MEDDKISAKQRILAEIKDIENRISKTKYNKKTQHAIGQYKARIAHLKQQLELRGKKGPKTDGYQVRRSGDATVILIGFPSVGKSTLLNALTNKDSEVGAYEFTTLDIVPGMLEHKHAKIQILDVPGIVTGAASGRGRGREVLSSIQSADMIIKVIDVTTPFHNKLIDKELHDAHIRLNTHKPDVKIVKTGHGGLDIGATIPLTHLEIPTIEKMLNAFRIRNAQVVIREDITQDQLIDAITNNQKYIPGITILTKIDLVNENQLMTVLHNIQPDLAISSHQNLNLDRLKDLIFKKLDFMRVYTKEIGKKPDMSEPMIIQRKSTVRDLCNKLHKDFIKKFKFIKIWGPSAKFPGQKLSLKHTLKDKDIVEIHVK